jgi:transposase
MNFEEAMHEILSLPRPWEIMHVELISDQRLVEVHVRHQGDELHCPECGAPSPGYDSRNRRWRHLDLCEYQTSIVCDVPRVECGEHGVKQLPVPWAEASARFTARFECHVIDLLLITPMSATAKLLGLSWEQVAGIQARAVKRGLERRGDVSAKWIGIDETSFQKRHEYVSCVSDLLTSKVIYVADGHGQDSIQPFFDGLSPAELAGIEVCAMDMHDPFINVAAVALPNWEEALCFDRFHVAQLLGRAVDEVRRAENKVLIAAGDDSLKKTKFHWLKSLKTMSKRMKREFKALQALSFDVAKAWAIKEMASKLWHYKSRTWAKKAWLQLCDWADETGLAPMQRVARTIRLYWIGIVNAVVHGASNAASESINSRIQKLKGRANGYRNRDRFRDAIMFHLGGLDLYPRLATHTKP